MLSCLRSPRLIFIVGNIPNVSEIAPLLIVIRLEEFDYAGAAGVGLVMLLASFAILLVLNVLQNLLSRRALMYGVLLCTARATGEFGAVAVVSGHIRGETATMPLHVEILYNEYQSAAAAFAVASLPALFALVTLAVKTLSKRSSPTNSPPSAIARGRSCRSKCPPSPNNSAASRR